jgi:hypothetical protein
MTWNIELVRDLSATEAELAELEQARRALALAEEGQNRFLDEYYARILPLSERLVSLQTRLKSSDLQRSPAPAVQPRRRQPAPLEADIKILYRALMKTCHPDHHHGTTDPLLGEVQNAYRAHDIARLWRVQLRQELRKHATASAARDCLQRVRERVATLRTVLERREAALRDTDAARLYAYACELAADGIDHIAVTASHIERKIAAARLILWQRHMRTAIDAAAHLPPHIPQPVLLNHFSA